MRTIKRFVKMFTFNFCSRFIIDGILKALISKESVFCFETPFSSPAGLFSTLPPPTTTGGAAANLADPEDGIQVLLRLTISGEGRGGGRVKVKGGARPADVAIQACLS